MILISKFRGQSLLTGNDSTLLQGLFHALNLHLTEGCQALYVPLKCILCLPESLLLCPGW